MSRAGRRLSRGAGRRQIGRRRRYNLPVHDCVAQPQLTTRCVAAAAAITSIRARRKHCISRIRRQINYPSYLLAPAPLLSSAPAQLTFLHAKLQTTRILPRRVSAALAPDPAGAHVLAETVAQALVDMIDGAAERAAHAGAVARAVGAVTARVGGDGGAVGSVACRGYGRGGCEGEEDERWARHLCCVVEGTGVGIGS